MVPLIAAPGIVIPEDELHWSYARSSGPGGQNVNKVNTKAILAWRPAGSTGLPAAVRERFLARFNSRLTREGELRITSQRYRETGRNAADCLAKLAAMLRQAAHPPKPRKRTRPTRASKLRRVANKRRVAEKKRTRQTLPDD